MPIITLISDLKLRDPYVSIIKAGIMSVTAELSILDITHAVAAGNSLQTAYLLSNSYPHFPKGTLHLIYTDCFFKKEANPVLVNYDGHYFMGADDGVFSMFINSKEYNAVIYAEPDVSDLFLVEKMQKMVGWFLQNTVVQHTNPYPSLQKKYKNEPIFNQLENKIEGSIIYIDSFCNAITNIPTALFQSASKNLEFLAKIPGRSQLIRRYSDHKIQDGIELYFTSNIMGFLEIRMNEGRLAPLTGIECGDKIEIKFQ
ncbi:MAG: SAM-dependent chlorinase/fluorinase [Bacteroidales bacterium]|jgi:S-adenosylmethionine hydrolase|nr:SAM-dependent chlorinase/fluorinase [Bacteroidales bacterium]